MARKLSATLKNVVRLYIDAHIPMASASFCYYLTLSLFPILICLNAMLGRFFPPSSELAEFLKGILPDETISSLLDYINYVSENHSVTMVVFAVTAMATTSAGAFRTIDRVMAAMRGESRYNGFFAVVFSFIFSIIFLLAIYVSVILIATGKWFVELIDRYLMFVNISGSWSWLRFVLLFALLFVMIIGIYRVTAPKGRRVRMLPGAAMASSALLCVSVVFSYFIGASLRYHVIYGSLASVMILMIWIFTCGMIVFIGNALNISLEMYSAEQ